MDYSVKENYDWKIITVPLFPTWGTQSVPKKLLELVYYSLRGESVDLGAQGAQVSTTYSFVIEEKGGIACRFAVSSEAMKEEHVKTVALKAEAQLQNRLDELHHLYQSLELLNKWQQQPEPPALASLTKLDACVAQLMAKVNALESEVNELKPCPIPPPSKDQSHCDNCGWRGEPKIKLGEIPDLSVRIDPGGVVPSGQCPKCKALCYPEGRVSP